MRRLARGPAVHVALLALLSCGWGCGAEVDGSIDTVRIGFQMHALECDRPGIQARLEASGIEGVCPLMVQADRTVTGVCRNVPAGAKRTFRLVYFAVVGPYEVELATAIAIIDLTHETRRTVTLDFPLEQLNRNYDDDGDSRLNIVEFCAGTDPRMWD